MAAVIAFPLGAAVGWAEDDDSRGFFLESIAPARSDGSTPVPGADQYDIELRLPSGLSLRRSFERREIERPDSVFDTGIAEVGHTGASLLLGPSTSMRFTRDEQLITDVFADMLEQHTTTGMQFQQGFGGGASTGTLTLSRALQVDRAPGQDELRTLTQSAALDTGLWSGAQLSAAFTQRSSDESAYRLQETGYRADLSMALSGGQGTAHYDFLDRLAESRSYQQRQIDLVAPFAVPGGTLTAEHHLREQIRDGSCRTDRRSSFAVPLDLVWRGASASYTEQAKLTNGSGDEKNVLSITAPFRMLGHDATLEHIATETIRGEAWQDQRVVRLSAQFAGSPGVIERTETATPSGEDVRHATRLRIQTPAIHLTEAMSLSASHVRDEVNGDETSSVSRIALKLRPLQLLDVAAGLTMAEAPGREQLETRDVQTVLTLSSSARLRGSITEREQVDGSPAIVRHLELQRDAESTGDVNVRVGYTSFGAQEEEEESALLAQISIGRDTVLGLDATYAEYDERKLEPLAEPTTTVEVRAGDPARLGVRAAFSEQASRVQPERALGLAMGLFGGSLRFEFINNPLDPRGKVVMLSDVYDVGYRRTVFGGVGMDLGYRYFLPDDEPGARHFFKLRLDGGQVERGGTIALSYLSGHFVPYPRSGEPPASLLDLSYEKHWPGDEGRLTLTLSREEAPTMSVGIDDNIEGEIRYQTLF